MSQVYHKRLVMPHLALVHVAGALVVVRPRREVCDNAEHVQRRKLLVRSRQPLPATNTTVVAFYVHVHLQNDAKNLTKSDKIYPVVA